MLSLTNDIALSDLHNAADDLGVTLMQELDDDRPAVAALGVAALRASGWTGEAADQIVGALCAGIDSDELVAAKRRAATITDPWTRIAHLAHLADDEGHDTELHRLLRVHAPHIATTPDPGGVKLSLDSPPAPPRWVVPNFLVRGKVHMLSGPVGAMKSGVVQAMMAASITGRQFLGQDVPRLRWMIVDGENSTDDLIARWTALGVEDEHLSYVHLTTRQFPVALGEPHWNEWLRSEVETFKPDVLVLDTVSRVCSGVAVNDNDAVAALYSNLLVPLVDAHDLALVYTHHERKTGGRAGTDDAALGAIQWSGQAEQTITVAATGPLTETPNDDGTTATFRPFVLRRPKGRTLVSNAPEHFEVRGRLSADRALLDFQVQHPRSEPTDAERLIAALDRPLGRSALANAVAMNPTGTKFRSALAAATDDGRIVKDAEGLYVRGDA